MSEELSSPAESTVNHGWRVAFAGLGINLALGILYTWSVIKGGIPDDWGWDAPDKALPYSVACLVFALIMVPAGRLQDKFSPRLVATIGGILVGLGMILASRTQTVTGYVIGFGILAGAGIGFGYASATPPAVKWFPPAKTGMIAGIVVSGFGLALAYAAPLCTWMIGEYGLPDTVMYLGIAFLIVVVGLAQLLKAPPAGYIPADSPPKPAADTGVVKKEDFTPLEVLRTWQFYAIWFMYACGAGAGLMIISAAKGIMKAGIAASVTDEKLLLLLGTVSLIAMALGNGGGRVIAGALSDKLGRNLTLFMFLVCHAILLVLLSQSDKGGILASPTFLIIVAALVGANYGSNLALFPSMTKDFFGLKNFGMNYGLVFTAWGIGGFTLALLAAKIYKKTQSYNFAFFCSAALLIIAAIMVFLVKAPYHKEEATIATE